MISRAAEIVIILLLRYVCHPPWLCHSVDASFSVVFLTCNKRRDRALAEGRVQYDDRTVVADITDWQKCVDYPGLSCVRHAANSWRPQPRVPLRGLEFWKGRKRNLTCVVRMRVGLFVIGCIISVSYGVFAAIVIVSVDDTLKFAFVTEQ